MIYSDCLNKNIILTLEVGHFKIFCSAKNTQITQCKIIRLGKNTIGVVHTYYIRWGTYCYVNIYSSLSKRFTKQPKNCKVIKSLVFPVYES